MAGDWGWGRGGCMNLIRAIPKKLRWNFSVIHAYFPSVWLNIWNGSPETVLRAFLVGKKKKSCIFVSQFFLTQERGCFLVPSFIKCRVNKVPSGSESLSFVSPSFASPAKPHIARLLTYKILSSLYRIHHSLIKYSSSYCGRLKNSQCVPSFWLACFFNADWLAQQSHFVWSSC